MVRRPGGGGDAALRVDLQELEGPEAFSFFVSCEDQAEVDDLWARLIAGGGEESQCGWLKDRYGLWWQIIPTVLMDALGDPDPEKARRSLDAMLGMKKIDVRAIEAARNG